MYGVSDYVWGEAAPAARANPDDMMTDMINAMASEMSGLRRKAMTRTKKEDKLR